MTLSLSNKDLQTIADQLFLLKSPRPSKLPKPINTTGGRDLTSKLDPIIDPVTSDGRFKDIGIGVVDFTSDFMNPKVWLHNPNDVWRVASTGKMAILLAAVQLRDDVPKVKATRLV